MLVSRGKSNRRKTADMWRFTMSKGRPNSMQASKLTQGLKGEAGKLVDILIASSKHSCLAL